MGNYTEATNTLAGAFDDDDILDDDNNTALGPNYRWFQRPGPEPRYTFVVAFVLLGLVLFQYAKRVQVLKKRFGGSDDFFHGSLRFCAMISAFEDNDDSTFAAARLVMKSFFFLGLLQLNFHHGFLIMLGLLVLESSLDVVRILLAYRNCDSLDDVKPTSTDEAKSIAASTELEPTNVYEDLTRPRAIAVMVFLVQGFLIGIVIFDTYSNSTRTCFNGVATDVCPMLMSLGSYCLYFLGTFMACVFYVGPMNSYGKKEHDPVFWLKLFLMSKETSSVLSWTDPHTNKTQRLPLEQSDWRIWMRFLMSFVVNSVCFNFLLHALPIQIASKSAIMGVVFSSVGMIYLVDLDDTSGTVMTLVPYLPPSMAAEIESHDNKDRPTSMDDPETQTTTTTTSYHSVVTNGGAGAGLDNPANFEAEKQRLVDQAMKDLRVKLEALASGHDPHATKNVRVTSMAQALFFGRKNKDKKNGEDAPLLRTVV